MVVPLTVWISALWLPVACNGAGLVVAGLSSGSDSSLPTNCSKCDSHVDQAVVSGLTQNYRDCLVRGRNNLFGAAAQSESVGVTEIEARKELDYRPVTIALEAGTTGPGGSVNWRFADHLGLRAGFQYFSYSVDDVEIEEINYSADLRLMWEPLALDVYPWKSSSFRITLGVLLNQNKLDGVATAKDPTQTVEIGGNNYNLQEIGGLLMEVEQQAVSPYVVIGGNVYLGSAKRWSLMGELGVAYTGSLEISLAPGRAGTVSKDDLEAEISEIEDKVKEFKFWPVIKLGVCFSF